ncbi:MAG: isoprenylcysteine carboxylmethyltransferase family protein [Ignavibacteriaceae bacterium]|nr:isoprenylcysteine carboxylmethyltransferase family protein [Ignavibacteriaceae bacterium]
MTYGSIPADIFVILALNLIFAVSHTLFASRGLKKWFLSAFPAAMPYYRFIYNLISFLTLGVLYYFAPNPPVVVYRVLPEFKLPILLVQLSAVAGFLWVMWHIDGSEFLGLRQIVRKLKGKYDLSSLDEESTLMIKGPYKYSRHPIYLFSIIILIAQPVMNLLYFVSTLCFILYFYIGSVFEERKLSAQFGQAYNDYKKATGRILPKFSTLFK